MDPQNTYLKLKGVHKNEKACFIVGAGPSLFFASQNKNFNKIFEHVVISVNSSIMLMPWKEGEKDKRFFISCDHLCTRWSYWLDYVIPARCIKIVRSSWFKYKDELPGFLYFRPRSTSEGIIDPKEDALSYPSSCPSAVDLALQMGCKNIFLLGVDHDKIGEKVHFWDFFSEATRPRQIRPAQSNYNVQSRTFPINLEAYRGLLGFSRVMSANIYNVNPQSKVEIFKKITFDDIFKILENK